MKEQLKQFCLLACVHETQWIGRKEPPNKACIAWPPRSPDLTSCDFYRGGGVIKDCVYVPRLPADLLDLRYRMEADVWTKDVDFIPKPFDAGSAADVQEQRSKPQCLGDEKKRKRLIKIFVPDPT
ncbi:hypothetical protein TNCV_1755871 [Trichonephila clavipes]|nr:hypothetical protein TNCV_1755871 [Trichonephila clavipes]